MPFDNYTIRKFRALKECPQGQLPGDVFEATEDAGGILVLVGAAERVADDTPVTTRDVTPEHAGKRGTYNRRDMRAKDVKE